MKRSLKSLKQSLSSLSTCVVGSAARRGLKNGGDGKVPVVELKNGIDRVDTEPKLKNGGDKENSETKMKNGEVDKEDHDTKLKNGEADGEDPETKLPSGGVREDPQTNLKTGGDNENPETKLKAGEKDREDPETKLKNEGDKEDPQTKLKYGGHGEDPKTRLKNEERVGEGPQRPNYSNFKEQAIEYVKQAVQEDNAGNYAKAFPLYMNALEYFKTHLKYEKNPKIREAIVQKFNEYLRRAEEIRAVLDEGIVVPAAGGSYARVAARSKAKPKDGEGDFEGLHYAIVQEKPNVKWSDVAGLESAKQALQEAHIMPIRFPHFFTGKRQPWRTFLLYGPPGTGKSYLAKAVATEAYSTFFSVSSSNLVSTRVHESEKVVTRLFQMARESKPSVIFIDEIECLSAQRGEGNGVEAARRVITGILSQMKAAGTHDDKVLVLAATHTPYSVDQDIRKRFDKCIYIPLPDSKARRHILKVHLGDTPNNLTESDFESLARETEGFSGSDIDVCVKDVLFEPIRKTQDATFFVKTTEDLWVPCGPKEPGAVQTTMQELAAQGMAEKISPPPITRTDFDKVLARQKPSVSKSDIEVHERFTKEFGEEG